MSEEAWLYPLKINAQSQLSKLAFLTAAAHLSSRSIYTGDYALHTVIWS